MPSSIFGAVPENEINNEQGILPLFEGFYIESIIYSAERADAAFQRFDKAILIEENKSLAVANIQEALSHVGELSRHFWPSRDKGIASARAGKLREAFALDESSPLKDRRLRDAMEHFDERLDTYLKQFPTGEVITTPIVGSIERLPQSLRIFRMVDPTKSAYIVLDEQYEFGPIRESTKIILDRAKEMLNSGGRLPSTQK